MTESNEPTRSVDRLRQPKSSRGVALLALAGAKVSALILLSVRVTAPEQELLMLQNGIQAIVFAFIYAYCVNLSR